MKCCMLLACLALLPMAAGPAGSASAPAYFRYPAIHDDRIVFSAEADLWIAPAQGGLARRLTSHAGNEYFAFFSPDGNQIAFSAQYDGNVDVFTISAEGGEPRRLTWHPSVDEVIGWTPDGKAVLFRSNRASPQGNSEIWQVPASGGDPERLPIGYASRLSMNAETGQWAFNRSSWENATWKRYRGGTAPQIWVGSPAKADYRQVSTFDGSNAFPMWHGGRIWYLCDKGGTMNIWSMKPDGTDLQRHTDFKDWDARWPAMGPDGRIVFVLGGDVHVFDPRDKSERKVEIELPSDRALTRSRYPDAASNLTWFDLSPDGDRIAVTTRGEVFSVPVKKGVTLPVTRGSGARESWGSFDNEGKRLIYVTDEPGEEEIRIRDAWGRGEPKVVKPAGQSGWHFAPILSPDGKWVAYGDQTQALWVIPAGGGAPRQVDKSTQAEIREYAWSPDSRWLAYSKAFPTQYSGIYVYDTKAPAVHAISGPATDDFSPAWDPDGRYLYFLSHRNINPVVGSQDWDNVEVKNVRPYLVLLRKDVTNPLAEREGLPEDESKAKKDGKTGTEKAKKATGKEDEKSKKPEPPKPVDIDFDGIADRVVAFDVPIGRYTGLLATSSHVYYVSMPVKGYAESGEPSGESGSGNTLMFFELEKRKVKPFMEDVTSYALAAKAKKIAVMKKKGEIYVVDASSAPSDLSEAKVDMSDVVIDLDPREEWAQMYSEAWRHQRDFFWDSGLGGLDWKKVRDQYATLLPRLSTRADVRDLMGQMIGELNNSHTYVWGGDPGVAVPQVSVGLLGADLKREGAAYRVERIYRGDPADNVVSPLRAPGADLKEGDYILAVNHVPFGAGHSFYSYFENLAERSVMLTVNSRNAKEGSRDVVVETIPGEGELRYADWVRRNREYVAQKTGGKVGYVHLPDMGRRGLIEFNTWFYPQLDRGGLIVDARWNGGGNVSQMIVERLRRKVVSFDRSRGGGLYPWPNSVVNGPFVVMTNEFAGSDGDIFPAAIQREKLAPVIGKRSWGGVVGIRGDKLLVDGGMLTEPEYAWWEPQGGWTIENHGVDPDIVVENMPEDVAKGVDMQLDRSIDEVLRLGRVHPPVVPEFGPVRPRTREAFQGELGGSK